MDVAHSVSRLLIRSVRLVCGLVLLGLGIASCSSSFDKLGEPFAAQSFLGLAGGLLLLLFSVMLGWWAWVAAFGPGPEKS